MQITRSLMYRVIFALLLAAFCTPDVFAQHIPGAVTVRATEYNTEPSGLPLANFKARVDVQPAAGSAYTIEKECAGTCVFDNLPKGSTLVFSATKSDDIRNGVSTYDLVLQSKHINKEELLHHPAQLIAADVDCNGLIETKDIVLLRKLILPLPLDSTFCRYWTLLDASAILPLNPLQTPLPFEITLRNYTGQNHEINFLAIKNGNLSVEFPAPRASTPPAGELAAAPQPNPTPGPVWFGVYLPEAGVLLVEIFDAAGRRVFSDRWPGQAGTQQFELPETALPVPGIYIWRITAEQQDRSASGKIVRM
ncbi:MAG: T9SS type A sorting domain-containing protein [Lewinellaceae bacterium]|nr:T9SS type A sorting domain-containing protein [Lewinellaceae bacterium]